MIGNDEEDAYGYVAVAFQITRTPFFFTRPGTSIPWSKQQTAFSFRQSRPVLHAGADDLPSSSGCDSIACTVALRVLATRWNSGAQKSRPCAPADTCKSVQHVTVGECMRYKAPDGFADLHRLDAATRTWLKELFNH